MDLQFRISRVEYNFNDSLRVFGRVWGKYSESLNCSSDCNRAWFFPRNMPEPVTEMIHRTDDLIWIDLQSRGVVPKEWPAGITPNDQEDTSVFKFSIDKTVIVDPEWSERLAEPKEDQKSRVYINISSNHHPGMMSEVLVFLEPDHIYKFFKVLDENL
jgi:hypothetical protein